MKRRILLACVALSAMLSAMAERHYTFNAVALNVDGLPVEILNIEINDDGKEAEGATTLCNKIANSGWDIVGFSEDFNFHSELTAAPASTYYNFGAHGGGVSGVSNSTDGLGFACAKRFTMAGGTKVEWTSKYGGQSWDLLNTTGNGVGKNGADEMINKGFRMYTVTIADGIAVDVYVLHMDAGTADEGDSDDLQNGKDRNIIAREAQLKQLADYIKANHNNRPVIILGDTNCRYTREQLKTGFIDYINADSRLTINDPWVDLMWGGAYPTYDSDAMMTDANAYGMQKGEIVDKVFYINTTESNLKLKANSYLHDESVNVSEHKPVVVNFTLTDPNGNALTDAEKEDNWTLEEKAATFTKPTWEGEKVVSGTTYYLMNVGTGECIRTGGAYYTQAVAGNAALKITPTTSNGGTTWVLGTYRGKSLGTGGDAYTDQSGEWYLEQVSGTTYQYRLKNTGGTYLTATTTDAHHPVRNMAGNASDDNQKWIFLTDARIRTEMNKANADYPFNFTALLKSADFDVIEFEDGWTAQGWTGFNQDSGPFKASGHNWGGDALAYSAYAYANQKNAATMSQSLGTLPNGIYDISFTGFYRSRTSSNDQTITAAVKFGDISISVKQNKNTTIGDFGAAEQFFRVNNNTYRTNQQITLNRSSSITLQVTKPSSSKTGWICVDNFRLLYYGTSTVPIDPYKEYKEQVRIKVNETYEKVLKLNAAGQAAYDITIVINRYNNDQIRSAADADELCKVVDNAYANALAAHLAYIVSQAIKDMQANGGDLTGAIINPSFETGNLTGWTTAGGGWDVGVQPNSNATFTTNGCDGAYLFNSYGGDNDHTAHIEQTIKGVPNGLYELKVKVTSFEDRYVYITGNGYHARVATSQGKGMFHEATLYFLVEDGSAKIGAVGGNKGGGATFVHYWPDQGCFFKADNFRLKYICDVPHGRLKLALNEAENANLDAYGQAALNISEYQDKYNNKSLGSSDGKTEAAAVYTALQTAAKAQRTKNADMTWAITNHSFETGDYTGWTTTAKWDTGVKPQENGTYSVAGTDGRYLFNTWDNQNGTNNTNVHITQTVTGIPNGTYRLTAMLATDAGTNLELIGNGTTTTIAANGAVWGVFPTVECKVTDGTLTIEAGGADGAWYKCDDFHLTYLGHELKLSENETVGTIDDWYTSVTVARTIKHNKWSTFVVPFDMAIPAGWEVMELKSSAYANDKITLTFEKAESIKAGVAYMVRHKEGSNVTTVSTTNVQVTTTLDNPSTQHVEFVGTYTNGYVPKGSYFISDNVFYLSEEDKSNKIKAFRAYLKPTVTARSIGYRFAGDDEEGTTDIDAANEEVTVVGIYTLGGVRINEMQQGVNILQMSDGSVVKVVIK